MKEEELEPCMGCTPSDLQIILELQRTVCEYERFIGDLMFDLAEGCLQTHLMYDLPIVSSVLEKIDKLLQDKPN